jgi:transcriptional regulator with XRE-family HTH domain
MPGQLDGTFAGRLRNLMVDQAITIERLAMLSGISVRSITRYRAGEVEPRDAFGRPSPNAWKLARALRIEVDELVPSPASREPDAA